MKILMSWPMVLVFLYGSVQTFAQEAREIRICGDGSEWPPFHFLEKDANGNKTDTVIGYSVDVLNEILKPKGYVLKFFMPPWKRCLSDTENGKYHIALDASYSEERQNKYLLTASHYATHAKFFFVKERFKSIHTLTQSSQFFAQGNVCGLQGYNYEGISSQIKNNQIEQPAKNFTSLVAMTKSGRCAFFIARSEIIHGFSKLGENLLGDGILGETTIPDSKPDLFYLLISRQADNAQTLLQDINSGIHRLRTNHRLEAILKKWISS